VIPTKALRTQQCNAAELARLRRVFERMPLAEITPHDVRGYLDARGKKAPVAANREIALLSHLFNKAREWGIVNTANPCPGVQRHAAPGRDRYVEDHEYRALYDCADAALRDAMDLAYLTSQRPADVLKMRRADVRDGCLHVQQAKTGRKLRIELSGELARVIERIASRAGIASLYLVHDARGQRLTYWALRNRFDKARAEAGVNFQFRDLRAKAASDAEDLAHAQKLLGHRSRAMTEHYTRDRVGDKVKPLK
jgi:integrase